MTDVLRGRLTTLYAAVKSDTFPAFRFLHINEGLNKIAQWCFAANDVLWQPNGTAISFAQPSTRQMCR
jgi:hypothetical protein